MTSPSPKEIVNVLLRLSGDVEGQYLDLEAGAAEQLKAGSLALRPEANGRPLYESPLANVWRGTWKDPLENDVDIVGKVFTSSPLRVEKLGTCDRPLSHPYIQPLIAYGGRSLFGTLGYPSAVVFVYPFIKNRDLDGYITEHGATLTTLDKLDLLTKIAQGLAYMHNREPPIAHGGLKPGHVLIDDNLAPRIMDFGLYEEHMDLLVENLKTASAETAYRPSPYEESKTSSGDVFSFAKLAFFVMTGKRPRPWNDMRKEGEKNPSERDSGFNRAHYDGQLDDEQLWDLLEKWGDADPKSRPTMIEVVVDLNGLRLQRSTDSMAPDLPAATSEEPEETSEASPSETETETETGAVPSEERGI